MEKVSIIIPCYNQAEYLSQAIESAVRQDYPDFEIVVVNDGSTDNSLEIAQQFNGIRIVTQENKGLAEARNTGIREAQGSLILPLDSDDYIDPTYLTKTVPRMEDFRVGIVSTVMQYFGLQNICIPPRGLSLAVEKSANELPVCSLIRRAAINDAGGYETVVVENQAGKKVYGFEDWELWIDIMKHGWKVAVVDEALFHYRLKPSSMVTEASTVREALIREIRRRHPDVFGGIL